MAWLTLDTDELLCDETYLMTVAGSAAFVKRDNGSHRSSWKKVQMKEWSGTAWQCEACGWISSWELDRCDNCKAKMFKRRSISEYASSSNLNGGGT